MDVPGSSGPACCHGATACVFTKALLAHDRHGSLMDLPWQALVEAIVAWQPRRRRPDPLR